VTGNTILPSNHNPVLEDIGGNGLSAVLVRDGRAPMTGPLNMGNNRLTNLAAGSATTDAVNLSQLSTVANGIGFRNQIINGDFDIWQRAVSQSTSGYGSDDRWNNFSTGSTKVVSRQAFALGQTAVPGNPKYFSRTVVTSVAGPGNGVNKTQPIEFVSTLSGQTVTVTFYAKADANKNIAVEFSQVFGTGGSPSATINGIGVQTCALTTSFQKFSYTVAIPSISGKALGSNNNDSLSLSFWFDAGSNFNSRTNSLGQQSGTFDISHVSVVAGDATLEADPFSPRHIQQELALCQRYYSVMTSTFRAYAAGGSNVGGRMSYPVTMRAIPSVVNVGATFSNASAFQTPEVGVDGFGYFSVVTATGVMFQNASTLSDAEL
jgi:hypothetical protein